MLVKTLVIKSEPSIMLLNDFIKSKYGESSVDIYDPSSWKYYLNISGVYHSVDTTMTVVSLDTLEEIVFSRENLQIHTATAKAYSFGTRYYYSLLSKYPDQEQLILGILYPVDIQKAIAAKDGAILGYPKYLVEPQEITLMEDLEIFIQGYLVRWNVQAFGLSDTLYNTAQHGVMYLNILPKLLNLRLKRCKTNEVHSFHIREYLASHGKLDKYLPYMTLKQALYLYRNIVYIENNAGKVEQFKELVTKLLTDRFIPLSEFSARHLNEFDPSYYPIINIRRKPVNTQYNVPEKDYMTLPELYNKERPIVYGNPVYLDGNEIRIEKMLQNSTSSVMQTKDLESAMIDYNDAVPDPLETVLLRQWVHMASSGYYRAVINFKDPKNLETRTLTVQDAFIYLYYISLKSINIDINEIPVYINIKHRKLIKPTLTEMLSVVDSSFIDIPTLASNLLLEQPNITECLSTSNFFNLAYDIYAQEQKHWVLVSNIQDHYKRALVQNMILTLYEDEAIVFETETNNFSTWLINRNLPEYDFDYGQAQELIKVIFVEATGLTIDSNKLLVNIQKAMIAILLQLSSYSIQLLREINSSKIKPLNWAAIRLGDLKYLPEMYQHVDTEVIVLEQRAVSFKNHNIEAVGSKDFNYCQMMPKALYPITTKIDTISINKLECNFNVYFNTIRLDTNYAEKDEAISNSAKFIGWEYYIALTNEQQLEILSIY